VRHRLRVLAKPIDLFVRQIVGIRSEDFATARDRHRLERNVVFVTVLSAREDIFHSSVSNLTTDNAGLLRPALVVLSFVLLVACESRDLSPLSKPMAEVTDDDRDVMKAVLDHLRPIRDRAIRRGRRDLSHSISPTGAFFLVLDSTIGSCEKRPLVDTPRIPWCLEVWLATVGLKRFPQVDGGITEAMFMSRNVRTLPIRGMLADDVVYIPSATVDIGQLGEFERGYPPGSAVVVFSAPAIRGRAAVIFYRQFYSGGGLVHLARVDGTWSIVTTRGWVE
jgi:hypothetical protein